MWMPDKDPVHPELDQSGLQSLSVSRRISQWQINFRGNKSQGKSIKGKTKRATDKSNHKLGNGQRDQ